MYSELILIEILKTYIKPLLNILGDFDKVSIVFLPAVLIAAITDLRTGMIRNRLTISLMVFAVTFHILQYILNLPSQPNNWQCYSFLPDLKDFCWACCISSFSDKIIGGTVCFMLMLLNFLVVGGGGGDVKLASAIGFGYGLTAGINILVTTFLVAAVFSCVILSIRSMMNASHQHFSRLVTVGMSLTEESESDSGESQIKVKLRMGPYFAIATCLYVFGAA